MIDEQPWSALQRSIWKQVHGTKDKAKIAAFQCIESALFDQASRCLDVMGGECVVNCLR
jgi:hypothetical protein